MYWGINARLIIGGVLVTLSFVFGWSTNGWRLNAKHQEEVVQALEKARKTEQVLIEQADAARKKKDNEIQVINNRLAAVTSELRKRASRNSQDPASCKGGTGSTLFAEDGEFLVGEAARADRIREALRECYERYESLRQELNK
jgi:hypothetical protein